MTGQASSAGMMPAAYLHIPNMLAHWPWKRRINPLYQDVASEGNQWLRSFKPFSAKSQHAFEICNFGLFSALSLPDASRDHLRACVDFANLVCAIDEYTDVESGAAVCDMISVCIDALHNPHKPRPQGEVLLGELTRQFWERSVRIASDQGAKHFVACFTDYLNAVVQLAETRDREEILTFRSYLDIRLEDVGVRPLYALGQLQLSIPDDVFDNSLLVEMTYVGCELITVDNDILSYNREQASGPGTENFNIVTVVMHHMGLDHQAAVDWLTSHNAQLEAKYMALLERVKTLTSSSLEFDVDLFQTYLDHMGNVRTAIWCWSFEGGRYFGNRGLEVARNQYVPLIPRKDRSAPIQGTNEVEILSMEEELSAL